MVAILGYNKEQIQQAVKDMYTVVARQPQQPQHFPTGAKACELAGYTADQLVDIPENVLASFAGVGCPFKANIIQAGDTVLDAGSGSGTDVLIAAKLVGEHGKVLALDVTPAMREKLQQTLDEQQIHNVEIVAGDLENIPLDDASVDVITTNGVINLVPDKRRAIGELFRVLKPEGHLQLADIVIASPVTPDCEDDPKMWAECVVGATVDENYLHMFRDAGFTQVEILRDYDYFAYSPSQETQQVAKQFGAHAYELRMQRAATAPAKIKQLAARLSPKRAIKNIQRRGLWGTVALMCSLLACYGTLALVGLLPLIGLSLALNEGIWAGAIVAFAALATLILALGIRKHQSYKATIVAVIGLGILSYTMFIQYSIITELISFALLALAVWLDYQSRRWATVNKEKKPYTDKLLHAH